MPVSRLFVEIGQNVDRLNASLRQATETAAAAGVRFTAAGQAAISRFDEALNPTKKLAEQLELLGKAGKTDAEIMAVMGKQLSAAASAATANGQAVDPLVQKYVALGKATTDSTSAVTAFGKTLTDFATNPINASKAAIGGFLEKLGPTAVGVGAVATAIGIGVTAFTKFAVEAANEAEALQNLSAQTGLSVIQLRALKQIQEEAGLEGLDLGRTISKLNEQLGDTKPNEFTKAMQLLGVSAKTAGGQTKDAVTVLDEMRIALLAIDDPTQQAQLAQQVLGGRLRDLIPLLLNSKAGLREMSDELVATGVVVDDLAQKRLLAFDEKLDLISRSLTKAKSNFTEFAASVFSMAEEFAKAHPKINLFGAAIAGMIGGESGLKLYNAIVGNSTATTKELTDAEKDLHNQMILNRGVIADSVANQKAYEEQLKKDAKASEDFKKSVERIDQQLQQTYGRGGSIDSTLSVLEAWSKAHKEKVGIVDDVFGDLNKTVKTLTISIPGMVQASRISINQLSYTINDQLGKINDAFSKETQEWKKKMMDGFTLPADLGKKLEKEIDPFKKKNEEVRNEIADMWRGLAGVITSTMARTLTDILTSTKGWGDKLKEMFSSIGKSLLDSLFETMLNPLKAQLEGLLTKFGGFLGGIFGGGGAGGGIPGIGGAGGGGIPGIGGTGGGAGGVAGAAGAFAGWGTGLLSGGLSAIGSIVGALIGRRDTKETEANTRYTAIDMHTSISYLDSIMGIEWLIVERMNVLDDIKNGIDLMEGLLAPIRDGIWNLSEKLSEILATLRNPPPIPKAAEGGFVSRSGLAIIHQGEMVIPASRLAESAIEMRDRPERMNLMVGQNERLIRQILNIPTRTRPEEDIPTIQRRQTRQRSEAGTPSDNGLYIDLRGANVYGWSDFVRQVERAGFDLKTRGSRAFA